MNSSDSASPVSVWNSKNHSGAFLLLGFIVGFALPILWYIYRDEVQLNTSKIFPNISTKFFPPSHIVSDDAWINNITNISEVSYQRLQVISWEIAIISVDPSSFVWNSYRYKDVVLGFSGEDAMNSKLFLQKGDQKVILDEKVQALNNEAPDDGWFRMFKWLPYLSSISWSGGDMCGWESTTYIVDLQNNDYFRLDSSFWCSASAFTFKNKHASNSLSLSIEDKCVEKNGKLSGYALLNDILINDQPSHVILQKEKLPCLSEIPMLWSNYTPPSFKFLGVANVGPSSNAVEHTRDMNAGYFSLKFTNEKWKTFLSNYILDFNTWRISLVHESVDQLGLTVIN